MRRVFAVLVGITLASVLYVQVAQAVQATPTPVIIDDPSPSLEEKDPSGWTTSLGLTNLTDGEFTLAVTPADADGGCIPTTDHTVLAPAQHNAITVTIPAGCKVEDDGIDLEVKVLVGDSPVMRFEVTAAPKPDDAAPEWGALWAFPIALVVLLLGALLLYIIWDMVDKSDHRFSEPLKYLDKTWSFKDSWVSNVTVAAGLLTGIFGASDVVEGLLGEEAERSIALAIVGAAVAAAFIGAGPIVLLTTKARGAVTVGGILFASAFTLAGAFGELWVVYRSGSQLELGGWEDNLWIVVAAASGLLLLYGVRSMIEVLELGTTKPKKPPASDTIRAAMLITEALKATPGVNVTELENRLTSMTSDYPVDDAGAVTSLGDDYRVGRRSAML